jgi:hypothetical protein
MSMTRSKDKDRRSDTGVGMLQTADENRPQASSEAGNDYETERLDERIRYAYLNRSITKLWPCP